MHRRILTLISVGVLALGLAACGSSSKSTTPAATTPAASGSTSDAGVTIDSSFTFHTTPVKAGSTVTVKNESTTNHTVTADDGSFDVPLDASGTASFTAPSKPGTYKIHCKIHSFMHGELTVN